MFPPAITSVITDAQAASYHENGYLVLPGALDPAELARVQDATAQMLEKARPDLPDHTYKNGVLGRIEYVIDKHPAMQALAAHPFILRTTEKLMGPDLFPTWDAMVVKMPGRGVAAPWHRDAATDKVGDKPIFNVDFYLDEATEQNCVWVLPGTHKWPREQAEAWIKENRRDDLTVDDYKATGALPVLMHPGDVLLHDIQVLHGSPTSHAKTLRRVVYYEFRTAHVEAERGPHTPDYIPLKQTTLLGCLKTRQTGGYALPGETPFVYNPPAPFDTGFHSDPPTYRYVHSDYWRKDG